MLFILGGAIWYKLLPNRHKAIIKTTFLQKLALVDNESMIKQKSETNRMITPTFYVDSLYKSTEGPKSSNFVQLSQELTLFLAYQFSC